MLRRWNKNVAKQPRRKCENNRRKGGVEMNKLIRILMSKSVRRVLNPKKVSGLILAIKLLKLVKKRL